MVRVGGFEPPRFSAADFESAVSAVPPHPHMEGGMGVEPMSNDYKSFALTIVLTARSLLTYYNIYPYQLFFNFKTEWEMYICAVASKYVSGRLIPQSQ